MSTNEMHKGTVKFFNATKGFGFIKVDGSDDEVFFHVSGARISEDEQIDKGQKVSFEIEAGKRGPRAVNVVFD